MNGSRDQLFTCTAFASDEDAASLRSDSLNHVEDLAHLGALANDIVETSEPPQLAAQIPGFLFPLEAFRHLADSAAELIHQFMVLNDVAIGPRIDRGNSRLHGRHAGNKQEEALRGDLLG